MKLPASLRERPFLRQMLTLMSGTAGAQVISILLTPIIARLFSPEDYGLQGLYVSISTICTVLVCLKYEYAIVLPAKDREARSLALLALAIVCGFVLLVGIAVLFAAAPIARLFSAPEIARWLYFVPLSLLLLGSYAVFSYYLTRQKRFKAQAVAQVAAIGGTSGTKLLAGWMGSGPIGLLAGILVGQAINAIGIVWAALRGEKAREWREARADIPLVAREYKQFPFFIAPQSMLNSLTQALPNFLLATYASVADVGHFTMSRSLILLPLSFLLPAFRKVYYPTLSDTWNQSGNIKPMLGKAIKGLFAIALLPMLLVVTVGPQLFSFVLGAEWLEAGNFARLICIWAFFGVLVAPATACAQVLRKQKILFYQELVLSLRVLAFWWFLRDGSALLALGAYTTTSALVSTGFIVYIWRLTGRMQREKDELTED